MKTPSPFFFLFLYLFLINSRGNNNKACLPWRQPLFFYPTVFLFYFARAYDCRIWDKKYGFAPKIFLAIINKVMLLPFHLHLMHIIQMFPCSFLIGSLLETVYPRASPPPGRKSDRRSTRPPRTVSSTPSPALVRA